MQTCFLTENLSIEYTRHYFHVLSEGKELMLYCKM